MDLITHAITGLALGTLSGESVSLSNPIYLSAMLGATAPDIDIIWGYNKLKRRRDLPLWMQHRAITHSIIGMPVLAAIIALGLNFLFVGTSFWLLFLFALMGTVSHSLLDLMNCYGVNIFWPIIKRAYSLNIVPLVDPILISMFLLMIIGVNRFNSLPPILFATLILYIVLRWIYFARLKNTVSVQYEVSPAAVQIAPSPIGCRKWIFTIEENDENISGEIVSFPRINVYENDSNK